MHSVTAQPPATALPDPAPRPPAGYLDAVAGQPLLPAARQAWLAAVEQALERPGPPAPPRAPGRDAAGRRPREHRGQPRRAPGRGLPHVVGPHRRGVAVQGLLARGRHRSGGHQLRREPGRREPCRAVGRPRSTPSRWTARAGSTWPPWASALATPADLLCVQAANGEVGTRQPLAEVAGGGACGRACRSSCTPSRSSVAGPCRPTGTSSSPPPATGAVPPESASSSSGPRCAGRRTRTPTAAGSMASPTSPARQRQPRRWSTSPRTSRSRRTASFALTELHPPRAAPARRGHRGGRRPRRPAAAHRHVHLRGRDRARRVVARARPARHQRGERLGLHLRHPHAQPGTRGDGAGGRRVRPGVAPLRLHGGDRRGLPAARCPTRSPRLGQDA